MYEYEKLEDTELTKLSKQGDVYAKTELIDRYKKLVKVKGRTFFLIGGDKEDVMQEGMIGLIKAIDSYDESKNAKFSTFAELCVSRQIMTAVKVANRQKNNILNDSYSLNNNVGDGDNNEFIDIVTTVANTAYEPEKFILFKELKGEVEQQIKESLSKFERTVLHYYIVGESYESISKITEKDEKAIDNALQRVRKKLNTVI